MANLSISGVAVIEAPNYQLKTKVDMKLELKITDEQGNEHLYNVVRNSITPRYHHCFKFITNHWTAIIFKLHFN